MIQVRAPAGQLSMSCVPHSKPWRARMTDAEILRELLLRYLVGKIADEAIEEAIAYGQVQELERRPR